MTMTWRKSSQAGAQSNCVEVRWRKSSRSGVQSNCVELGSTGAVRDSKNPVGPTLAVDLPALVTAVKSGRLGG
jgi:hypothetical protein